MCKPSPRTRSTPAFTLVELLIVIGIIALLISILLPALGKARSMAMNIKCQANLHTISLAIALYEDQYKYYLPAASTGNGGNDTHWDATLQQLLGRTGNIGYNQANTSSAGMLGKAFLCPAHLVEPSPDGTYECDYGTHPRLMPQLQDVDNAAPQTTPPTTMHQVKVTQVQDSSNIVLVMDATQCNPALPQFAGYYTNWDAQPAVDNIDTGKFSGGSAPGVPNLVIGANGDTTDQSQPVYVRYVTDAIAYYYPAECIRWRHNNYANFLFVDGHVGQFYCNPKDQDTSGSIFNGHYITNLMRRNVWLPYIR